MVRWFPWCLSAAPGPSVDRTWRRYGKEPCSYTGVIGVKETAVSLCLDHVPRLLEAVYGGRVRKVRRTPAHRLEQKHKMDFWTLFAACSALAALVVYALFGVLSYRRRLGEVKKQRRVSDTVKPPPPERRRDGKADD